MHIIELDEVLRDGEKLEIKIKSADNRVVKTKALSKQQTERGVYSLKREDVPPPT